MLALATLCSAFVLVACPADDGESAADAVTVTDASAAGPDVPDTSAPCDGDGCPLTWSSRTRQIAETHCVPCHVAGGAAPFALTSHADWELWGLAALAAIDAGRMPPWMPDPDCREFVDARILPADDAAALRQWVESGTPIGDPATAVIEVDVTPQAIDATHTATVAAYTPVLAESDDYRCFLLDMAFPETVYMTNSLVVPGNELVHHVLVYSLAGGQADTARALDAEDEAPGYTCFGGPIPLAAADGASGTDALSAFSGLPNQIGGWVPGAGPRTSPEGIATRISAGSTVVAQIHYSAVAGEPQEDGRTRFEMRATTDEPTQLAVTGPVTVSDLQIPAGEAAVAQSFEVPYYGSEALQIRSMAGHMHLFGTRIHSEILSDAGSECLFDIPRWDFNWQQGYFVPDPDGWVRINSGERVRLTCEFDNSTSNQPVVNGVQQEPADVTWGDGTLDEMCILYLQTVAPFSPEEVVADGADCSQACVDACGKDPTVECLLRCSGTNLACVGCAFEELATCGGAACIVPIMQESPPCFQTCFSATVMLRGDTAMCFEAECPTVYSELNDCLNPLLVAAECETQRASCGLTW